LAANELTGTIPSQIGLLTKLATMYFNLMRWHSCSSHFSTGVCDVYRLLNNNLFQGTIPAQLGQMSSLQSLFDSIQSFGSVSLSN
jgi:hypothetical protein